EVSRVQVEQEPPERHRGGLPLSSLGRCESGYLVQLGEGQTLFRMPQQLQLGVELVPEIRHAVSARPIEAVDQVEIRAEPPDQEINLLLQPSRPILARIARLKGREQRIDHVPP